MRRNLPYLSLASLLLLICFSPHSFAQLGGPNGKGQWSGIIQLPLVPASAANLPDGKILTWSAYDRFAFGGGRGFTYTAIFDPATNSSQEVLVSNTQHDMFCPGIAYLPDGTIMVTDGSAQRRTSIYDPNTSQWASGPAMNIPRGYHGMLTLANGNVFTIGGSWSGGVGGKSGELLENGSWRVLNGLPNSIVLNGVSGQSGSFDDNYAWMYNAPNGKIFHAGPSTMMNWIDPTGNGSYTTAGRRGNDEFSYGGIAVMYDVGKILKAGGASDYGGTASNGNTFIIDINTNQAQVTRMADMRYSRNYHNAVVLPNGEVFIVGGVAFSRQLTDLDSRLTPELYNPATNTWRDMTPMQVPRNYHSTALLLQDGRIFVGGGGLCATCPYNHPDTEIFSPPYLFDANGALASRPAITNFPSAMGHNSTQTITTDAPVAYFTLIRQSAVTHSSNNDQRRIPLTTTSLGNNNYQVYLPLANILPPGAYMLFAVNANGTPSVAKIVSVGANLNPPPVAPFSANPSQGFSPLVVSFDGTASTDNDTISSYSWDFGDGNTASGSIASHTYNTPGTYTARLTVTDPEGAINEASTLIEVFDPAEDPDGDGILNARDLDDDNDGILDTEEDNCPQARIVLNLASNTEGFGTFNLPVGISLQISGTGSSSDNAGEKLISSTRSGQSVDYVFTIPANTEMEISFNGLDGGHESINITGNIISSTLGASHRFSGDTLRGTAGASISSFIMGSGTARISSTSSSTSSRFIGPAAALTRGGRSCDVDGDNIVNSLDLDSDGDGCSDALEGTASLTRSDLNADGSIKGNVETDPASSKYGLPLLAGNGQQIGSSQDANVQDPACSLNPPPVARFTANPSQGNAPLAVSFDATSSTDDNGIASYSWDFGDGNTASGSTASHIYTNPGTYTVRLTVTNLDGLSNQATTVITASDPAEDPDGDGIVNADDLDDDNDGILDTEEDNCQTSTGINITFDGVAGVNDVGTVEGLYLSEASANGNWWEGVFFRLNNEYFTTYPNIGMYHGNAAEDWFYVDAGTHDGVASQLDVSFDARKVRGDAVWILKAYHGTGFSPVQNVDVTGLTEFFSADVIFSLTAENKQYQIPLAAVPANSQIFLRWEVDQGRSTGHAGIDNIIIQGLNSITSCDTDNDGIINSLDLDSDGDGCSDALEGTASISLSDLNADGSIKGNVETDPASSKYGLPLLAGNGQQIGSSQDANTQDPSCTANQAPEAQFSATPTSGDAPLLVSFDANASTDDNGISSYSWDFGDGNTGSGVTATHTYAAAGSYTATLTISDQEGLVDNSTVSIIVNEPVIDPPVDGDCFIVSGTQEVWIEAENFSAQQTGSGNASGSSWVVYDDPSAAAGKAVRSEPNAGVFTGLDINGPRLDYNVYFSQAGTYTLFVRGQGPTGSDDSFHAGLNGSPLTTTAGWGMIVSTAWTWASYANDGILVELDIPAEGSYTINLWMREDGVAVDKLFILPTGAGGPAGEGQPESSTADCDNVSPVNSAPTASFTATPTSGSAPLAVNFDGSASTDDNAVTAYSWDFGDGNTASGASASHTYTNPGQYVATLTVSDQEGLTNNTTENILVQSANNGNCFAEAGGQVVIEAEDFSRVAPGTGNAAGTSWSVVNDANASGAKAVEAGPNTGVWTGLNLNGSRLDFDIDFSETGIYFIYLRSQGASGNDDSYHIGLNGSGLSNTSGFGMGGEGAWAWESLANDDEVMQINIQSVGKQTFNIWVREDGVQIDKIIIKKVSADPIGQGPASSTQSPCGGNANQAPIASFTAAPSTGAAPLALTADASGSSDPDGSIASYAWDFGDGTQGSGQSMSHTYNSVGTYTLRLTVTDNAGLTNSSTRTIRVTPPANGPCYEEVGGTVVMEAENFSATSPGTGNASANNWQKVTDANASNSEALKAMPNNGTYTGLAINGPRVDYNINFQTSGTYRIYIRTQGATGQDDSYHVGLNGTPVSTTNGYGMGWTGNWGWAYFANEDDFVEVVVPSTGQHTFNIWMREDGVEIDKIVLKIQTGIPSGIGPDANEQAACPTNNFSSEQSFSVEESGGNGVVNWGNFFEEFKDNYTLERSVDGNTFEILENAEIIVDENYHTHTDPNIRQYEAQLIKYRLRIKDGRGITRDVREGILNFRGAFAKFDFKVYPNPATERLNLEFDNSSGKDLNLTILNSLGQPLLRDSIDGNRTDGILKLDVSDYATGIYFIKVTDGEKKRVMRIFKE